MQFKKSIDSSFAMPQLSPDSSKNGSTRSANTINSRLLATKSSLDSSINLQSYLTVTELHKVPSLAEIPNSLNENKGEHIDVLTQNDFYLYLNYSNLYGYDLASASLDSLYLKYLLSRYMKWKLLADRDLLIANKASKIKRFVKKGIPQQDKLRMTMWFRYSGAEEAYKKNELYYTNIKTIILNKKNKNILNDDSLIFSDINRTLPDNLVMKNNPKMKQKIFNIIKATLYSFDSMHIIDYHQCFTYIVAVLVLVMEEEKAFWVFNRTIKKIMPKRIYKLANKANLVETKVIIYFLSQNLPGLYEVLTSLENEGMPAISLAIQHWVILMFVDVLNVECVMRLFDMFYYMGYKVLIRCSLAIFRLNANKIIKMAENNSSDKMDIFQFIKEMPKALKDPNELIKTMNLKECKVKNNQILKQRKIIETLLTDMEDSSNIAV